MLRRSLHFEDCLHQEIPSITKPVNAQSVVCICCLETNIPLISLTTCTHSEYLDSFSIPELKPGSQVVCVHCHVILKKIQVFKQQLQNSFKILSDKTSNKENNNQRHNFNIHKAVDIHIPENYQNNMIKKEDQSQITKIESLKRSNKKMDNIQTALDIIQSNHNIGFLAASILNADSLFNLTSSLLKIDVNRSYKSISGHDEVPSKKIKLDLEHQNQDVHFVNLNLQPTTESQPLPVKPHEIQPDTNELQSDLNVIQQESKPVEQESNELQKDSNQIQLATSLLKLESEELQLEPNLVILESSELLPDHNKLQLDPNELQLDPNELQLDPNKLQLDPNKLQQAELNLFQRESNHNFNGSLSIPKAYKDKLNIVRITVADLKHERALQSQAHEYLECEYKCHSCIVGFQYQENLNDHRKRKHNEDSGSIVCKVCSQRVAPDSDYEFHIYRHYNRFQCVKCEERFQTCDEAIRHYQNEHVDKKVKRQKRLSKKRRATRYK